MKNGNNTNEEQLKKNKKIPKTKKRIVVISLVIVSIIFLFSCYKLIMWKLDYQNTRDEIKKIDKEVIIEKIIVEEPENEEPEDEEPENEEKIPLYSSDFSKLKKVNKDVIGFIKVNGTQISYPVVQTTDNDYYLKHSFNKSYNNAGWVFMDYRNTLSDNNIVIYGHGRVDYTMLGSLRNLLKESWFKNDDNKYISLITEQYTATYQIFSVYTTEKVNGNHVMVDFSNNYLFKLFADEEKAKSIIPFSLEIGVHDKVITLSTCKNGKELIVVHAKMVKQVDI